jgi:TonB family protein
MRILQVLAFLFAWLPLTIQSTTTEPLTAGRLVLLGAAGPVDAATLRAALTSPDAGVRAVAARLAGHYVAVDERPELEAALASEADAGAAAELVRTLLYFGRGDVLPALESQAGRIGLEARMPIYEWLARTDPQAFADRVPALLQDVGPDGASRVAPLVQRVAASLERPDLTRLFVERPTDPAAGGLLLGADLPVTARLLPVWRTGLLTSTAAAANCALSRDARFGHARVTFRPDGRPGQVAVDRTGIPDECVPVLAGLARLTLADADRPVPADGMQWVVLPLRHDYAACAPSQQTFFPPAPDQQASAPRKQRDVRPVYPRSMIEQRIQGTVFIDATISEAGCLPSARVVVSPALALSLAALHSVSRWQYEPATRAGTPMAVNMTLSVNFRLE